MYKILYLNSLRSHFSHPFKCLHCFPGSADRTVKFWDLETFEVIGSSGREVCEPPSFHARFLTFLEYLLTPEKTGIKNYQNHTFIPIFNYLLSESSSHVPKPNSGKASG